MRAITYLHDFDAFRIEFVPSHDLGDFRIWHDPVGIGRGMFFVPETHLTRDQTEELTIRSFLRGKRFVGRPVRQPVHPIGFRRSRQIVG